MPADVPRPRRAEQGVGQRVGDRVGVGVPDQAVGVRNRDAAEHEGAPFLEPMAVVADADADHRVTQRPSSGAAGGASSPAAGAAG